MTIRSYSHSQATRALSTRREIPAQVCILIVDEPNAILNLKTLLDGGNYQIEAAGSLEEASKRLADGLNPDLVLLDLDLPEVQGVRAIEVCRRTHPQQKVVAVSGTAETAVVVQAMRAGALDFIKKPIYRTELIAAMQRWLSADDNATQDAAVTQQFSDHVDDHIEPLGQGLFFMAASPAMRKIRAQLELVAKVDIPVLLLGETGVGKEIVARLLHKLSPRAEKPLLSLNCAALPADLAESELFGYEAGAFTGAHRSKPGKFELCHKGTILLDEIGEMSPALQAKLLQVLQDGRYSRLGGRTECVADCRVIAATNIDVGKAIDNKTLREDLYYRLSAFAIQIPPLRERHEDISVFLRYFTRLLAERYHCSPMVCSPKLVRACLEYSWPGNLRELGNFVQRHTLLQDASKAMEDLKAKTQSREPAVAPVPLKPETGMRSGLKAIANKVKAKAEREMIGETLVATGWNRKAAAARLHISYKALLYKIKEYQILPDSEIPTSQPEQDEPYLKLAG